MDVTPKEEDCLEVIYRGDKRVKDIAKKLNIKAPTLVELLERMERKGLIVHKKYGPVELTEKGREIAEKVLRRHGILTNFFIEVLGMDAEKGEEEACRIEHYLDEETIERFVDFIHFVKEEFDGEVLKKFREFIEKGSK